MKKAEIIETQSKQIDALQRELLHSRKANLQLKVDVKLLQAAISDQSKTVKVFVPAAKEKLTYKKWIKAGEKKYFERYFGEFALMLQSELEKAL